MQIRVHLADAGHAIIGDEVYGLQVTPFTCWSSKVKLYCQVAAICHMFMECNLLL